VTPLERCTADKVATDCVNGLISRREAMRRLALLGLSAATATSLVAACATSKVVSVADLLTTGYKAFHRGVGANNVWIAPEHTVDGYRKAIELGANVIDLDVSVTQDGVLVCHHDESLLGTTGVDANVADFPLARLPLVDYRYVVGPGWGTQSIPTLDKVLSEFGGQVILDCEPKDNGSIKPIIDVVKQSGHERTLVINSAVDTVIKEASAAGIYTHRWGIRSISEVDTAVAAGANILQILYADLHKELVDYALEKKGTGNVQHVICGPIQRRYERDAALEFNVDTFVSDAPGYLDATPQAASMANHIASQKIGAGWLQSYVDRPLGVMDANGVILSKVGYSSRYIRLGDFCGEKARTYSLEFYWKVENATDDTVRPTFRFCVIDDRGTGADADVANGYECDMRVNGEIRANKGGLNSFSSLGTLSTPAQASGAVAQLKVYVTATSLAIVRTDIAATTLASALSADTITSLPVSNLSIDISAGTVLRLQNGQYATVTQAAAIGATSITIEPLALSPGLAPGASLFYTLGPYADMAFRGDYIWVGGSTAGDSNGSDMTLTDLRYTANDV
jgi:glycerophosphoryl diester phosphodiesterase